MDARYNTLFIGKVLKEYDILDSTNSEAERLLKKNKLAEGTIVYTEQQTLGRGQMGNAWESDRYKNLTFSLILYPKIILPKEQFILNQVVSLGIKDALLEIGLNHVSIKWPNDILIAGKKIAGVLIQNSISGKNISHSIIGIGLNVNQNEFPEGIGNPTSIVLEQEYFELKKLLQILCSCIEKKYLMLLANKQGVIHQEYLDFLFQKDVLCSYQNTNGEEFKGIIKGVKKTGELLMEYQEKIHTFYFKEISFL